MGPETPIPPPGAKDAENRREEVLPRSQPALRPDLEPLHPHQPPPPAVTAQRPPGPAARLPQRRTGNEGQRLPHPGQPAAGLHLFGHRRRPPEHGPGRFHGSGGAVGSGAAGARVGSCDGSVGGGEDGGCVSADGGSVASGDGEEFAAGGGGCGDYVGYGGVDGDG